MRGKAVLYLTGVLLAPAAAWAAADAPPTFTNTYSAMLERQLFAWHIWTTGVSRLDDGALFGFSSIILAMAFATSGLGIILFKDRGLGFRSGWLVTLPTILAAMIAYCVYRPYPTINDLASMTLGAVVASLIALFIARLAKGAVVGDVPKIPHTAPPPKAVDDRRLKMAVRAPAGGRREF